MIRAIRVILFVLAWVGAAALLLVVLGAVFGVAMAPWASVGSPLIVFLFIPVMARAGQAVRRRRALAVATYLEQAVRMGMPIPRMLEVAQLGESPKVAVRLRELRELIEAGAPLDVALDEGVPEMPPRAVGLIGAGTRTGRLESVLAGLVAEGRRVVSFDTTRAAFATAYPVMMGTCLLLIVVMISVFVFPKFEQIMKDFRMPMPAVTLSLMRVARGIGPVVVLVVAVGALMYLGRAVWEVARPFGAGARPAAAVGRAVLSVAPPMRFVVRDRDLGDLLGVMADATEAGVSFDAALREGSRLYLGIPVRGMVKRWEAGVQRGRSVAEAARAAGLPGLVVGMLETGTAAGGEVPEVLRFLSRYYRARFSRVMAVVRGAVVPVTVLVFAAPVLWIALSLFVPMVAMVEKLTGDVGRMRP